MHEVWNQCLVYVEVFDKVEKELEDGSDASQIHGYTGTTYWHWVNAVSINDSLCTLLVLPEHLAVHRFLDNVPVMFRSESSLFRAEGRDTGPNLQYVHGENDIILWYTAMLTFAMYSDVRARKGFHAARAIPGLARQD